MKFEPIKNTTVVGTRRKTLTSVELPQTAVPASDIPTTSKIKWMRWGMAFGAPRGVGEGALRSGHDSIHCAGPVGGDRGGCFAVPDRPH